MRFYVWFAWNIKHFVKNSHVLTDWWASIKHTPHAPLVGRSRLPENPAQRLFWRDFLPLAIGSSMAWRRPRLVLTVLTLVPKIHCFFRLSFCFKFHHKIKWFWINFVDKFYIRRSFIVLFGNNSESTSFRSNRVEFRTHLLSISNVH